MYEYNENKTVSAQCIETVNVSSAEVKNKI